MVNDPKRRLNFSNVSSQLTNQSNRSTLKLSFKTHNDNLYSKVVAMFNLIM